jgi:dihydropteroate synthase
MSNKFGGVALKDVVIAEKDVDKEMRRIKVLPGGIKIMHDEAVFRILRLGAIRAPMANMIKEEMLAVGGDAAVHWRTISCKVKITDVILFGTLQQYKGFIRKMKIQPYDANKIAARVQKLLDV